MGRAEKDTPREDITKQLSFGAVHPDAGFLVAGRRRSPASPSTWRSSTVPSSSRGKGERRE